MRSARPLLILVDLGCFDRYKFDYTFTDTTAKANLPISRAVSSFPERPFRSSIDGQKCIATEMAGAALTRN
jgi:hypothetical protein